MSYGGTTQLITDRDGRFEIKRLSSGVGQYRMAVEPHRDFQPTSVNLSLDDLTPEIHLKAGHVIEGRLLDRPTGEPLAGVKLLARPPSPQPGHAIYQTEEPETDADGHFRFSTLPEGKVQHSSLRQGLSGFRSATGRPDFFDGKDHRA